MLNIGAASSRSEDLLDAGAVGGQYLLLEATDGEDLTGQGHLSGHCFFFFLVVKKVSVKAGREVTKRGRRTEVGADAVLREETDEGSQDCDTG